MTWTRTASALLAAGALALPAFSSAYACDGDKAEHKAPTADNAPKTDSKAAQKQDKSAPKDDKAKQSETGKTS